MQRTTGGGIVLGVDFESDSGEAGVDVPETGAGSDIAVGQ
jgi:hypothetical protein